MDHVVPLSKGGKWVWENLVTACSKCNGKKGSKSLKQLGWTLKQRPKARCAASAHPSLAYAYGTSESNQRCQRSCVQLVGSPEALTDASAMQEPSPYQLGILLGIETEFAKPPKVRAEECMLPMFG